MTTATIENDPISIQLDNSSTTVPSNEVWKVTISGKAAASGGGSENVDCIINGKTVAQSKANTDTFFDVRNSSTSTTFPFETVVVDGDTIQHSGNGALQIGGFVVNENYTP